MERHSQDKKRKPQKLRQRKKHLGNERPGTSTRNRIHSIIYY
jgi:hypothetical protein